MRNLALTKIDLSGTLVKSTNECVGPSKSSNKNRILFSVPWLAKCEPSIAYQYCNSIGDWIASQIFIWFSIKDNLQTCCQSVEVVELRKVNRNFRWLVVQVSMLIASDSARQTFPILTCPCMIWRSVGNCLLLIVQLLKDTCVYFSLDLMASLTVHDVWPDLAS